MRVLFATAELAPIAAVGELAATSAGLTAELRRQGVDVDVVVPEYGTTGLARGARTRRLDVPPWAGPARVRVGEHAEAGRVHLVEVPGMERPHPYVQANGRGWPDNTQRFLAFSQAVAALVAADPPDVLHLNDWHTAATLAAVRDAPPTVLSLHDVVHQGTVDGQWLDMIGPRGRHYEWFGACNPLSGGIALADAVVAASPTHATEIVTPTGGAGLDGALALRGAALSGIRAGIDPDRWDPSTDAALSARFTAGRAAAAGKAANRRAVLSRLGWPDDGTRLGVVVAPFTSREGVDLLIPVAPVLRHVPLRLVVHGAGDAALTAELARAAAAHPGWLAVVVDGDDAELAHRSLAAADVCVVPSRADPTGRAAMRAMRYGALPVVTPVGGLLDAVVDADAGRDGCGFVADAVEPVAIVSALLRATRALADRRRSGKLVATAMRRDWSWQAPAAAYREVYEHVVTVRPLPDFRVPADAAPSSGPPRAPDRPRADRRL